MKLNFRPSLAVTLVINIVLSLTASANNRSGIEHWSITKPASVFDSLKLEVKKSPLADNGEAFQEYVKALQFKDMLRASDNPLPAIPTSAGIFDSSGSQDSLSADDQLIFLYRNLGDRKAEAGVLSSIGTRAAISGDLEKAISFFSNALEINTEIGNLPGITKNNLSLARIHRYKGNVEEAIRYNQEVLQIALNTRNNRILSDVYMNLAALWSAQNKFKDAENLIMNKALPLNYYKLQDKVATMACYDQLAELYASQKRFSEAKWFCIQSNMLARKINHKSGIVNSLVNLGHVKMSIGDHQLALNDFREAEQLSITNKYNYKLVEIKNDLSKVYAKLGNSPASAASLNEFMALKDALMKNLN